MAQHQQTSPYQPENLSMDNPVVGEEMEKTRSPGWGGLTFMTWSPVIYELTQFIYRDGLNRLRDSSLTGKFRPTKTILVERASACCGASDKQNKLGILSSLSVSWATFLYLIWNTVLIHLLNRSHVYLFSAELAEFPRKNVNRLEGNVYWILDPSYTAGTSIRVGQEPRSTSPVFPGRWLIY